MAAYVATVEDLKHDKEVWVENHKKLEGMIHEIAAAQDGHQDSLIEHTRLLESLNTRVMNLEEDKFKRENMGAYLDKVQSGIDQITRNEQVGKEVDIANEQLRDFAEWVASYVGGSGKSLLHQYDTDHEWHDRNESYEDWG